MVEKLLSKKYYPDFKLWIDQVCELGGSCELVYENGALELVHLKMPCSRDNTGNDWNDLLYGRIMLSKVVSYKQRVLYPRIVDGKFIYHYIEKTK